jgi:hypothetical protein
MKSPGEFNMAAEIRTLLIRNPTLTAREVEALLIAKFPKQKINADSCAQSFSNARKQVGLRSGPHLSIHPDLAGLLAAKTLVDNCDGDFDRAAAVLKQLADLQTPAADD